MSLRFAFRLFPASRVVALGILVALAPALAAAPKKEADKAEEKKPRLSVETLAGLELRNLGPALMSGRIADVVVDPRRWSTWIVAVGSGGVWKTTNAGTTWTPIFDEQTSYSIGCVTLDPNDPDVIWVGTGENVGGRHVGYGDGVYRSLDGGATWEKRGLDASEHVGNIVIDPRDSNVVFVAAQGPLWSAGGERGLYKSTDAGASWKKVLGGGPYTGVNEVVADPRNADVLYAATHQRHRTVAALVNGGPESGIHKSTDGGGTWTKLSRGLPGEEMGKIGLAVSPQRPEVVYAAIELPHRKGGFYRSTDGGLSWEKRSDQVSGGTGPHYYQEIFADPHQFDRVYFMDTRLRVSDDGGKTFTAVGEADKHGDNHAIAFDRNDPDHLLIGSDGGLYETFDRGKTYKFIANLPVTQFYKIAVDDDLPFYSVYGGTQDNSSQGGPVRTRNASGIRNSDWFITLSADGHAQAVEPGNPDVVYSEWQQGHLFRYDRKTGEIVFLQPQGEPGDPPERFNWDAPILISPHDPARLYYASQRVFRSDDRGDSWRPISGDLSRGQDRLTLPLMGRVQSWDAAWDLQAMSSFGSVTSLAESPKVEGLIYAGTDDGLVQVSEDGGGTWRRAGAFPGLPDGVFVNDLKADLFDADTVYVALDDHKRGKFSPYLLRSSDRGRTWSSIAGDLPDRNLVWRVIQDSVEPKMLFAATELGIFWTRDGGAHWLELIGGVPTISFRDLAIQRGMDDLVAGSFGRGIFVLDDYSPLRALSEERLEKEAAILFPVKDALWYVPDRPLGEDGRAQQGTSTFMAPNPPFGAVFTYYLRDAVETRVAARQKREAETAKAGGDTPYPGWDALREEALEEAPSLVFTVRDADGKVVRRLPAPPVPGLHRLAWDLRTAATYPWQPTPAGDPFTLWSPLVTPGRYTVSLGLRKDGVESELVAPQAFDVVPLTEDTALPRAAPASVAGFYRQLESARGAAGAAAASLGEADTRVAAILSVFDRSTAEPALRDEAQALRVRLAAVRERLEGDPRKNDLGEPGETTLQRRLEVAAFGSAFSTYGPTPTHRRSIEIAVTGLAEVRRELEAIRVDLAALEAKLEAAGAPWTPGRSVPERE